MSSISDQAWDEASLLLIGSFRNGVPDVTLGAMRTLLDRAAPWDDADGALTADACVDAAVVAVCSDEHRRYPPSPGELIAEARKVAKRISDRAARAELERHNPHLREER